MTDLKKWLKDVKKRLGEVGACKKRRLTPEEIRIRAELLRKDFPKALRMLERYYKAIKYLNEHPNCNDDYTITFEAQEDVDQIVKEK